MAKKLLGLEVQGRVGSYIFHIYGTDADLQSWRADGLVVVEIENIVPIWIVNSGLCRPWCFFQDIFHFKNPFKHWDKKGGPPNAIT